MKVLSHNLSATAHPELLFSLSSDDLVKLSKGKDVEVELDYTLCSMIGNRRGAAQYGLRIVLRCID